VNQRKLTIFDIDETLFQTSAKVRVFDKKTGEVVKLLDNKEYNTYKLQKNEEYNYDSFAEFRSAKHFRETSKPINKMVERLKDDLARAKSSPGAHQVIIVTARGDFDEREIFLDTFRHLGIDIDSMRVERAGKIPGPSASAKKAIFMEYLNKGIRESRPFSRVALFDDAKTNLDALLSLKRVFTKTKFDAYLAHHDGRVTRYRANQ
jgi:hypothetical protein